MKRVKSLRKERRLSQARVADHLNISQSAYARLEGGITEAWTPHLIPLSELLEVRIEELVSDDFQNYSTQIENIKAEFQTEKEALIESYENKLKEKDLIIRTLKEIIKENTK